MKQAEVKKWQRFLYQPCIPLGKDGKRISGSKEHIALSREAASEGIVLLKNDRDTLPLVKGQKIVLLGKASLEYIRGGGGSGSVTTAYTRNIYEGMKIKEAEGKVSVYGGLYEFYKKELEKQWSQGIEKGMTAEPQLPNELIKDAARYTDTAILCICRFSGEGWDRRCLGEMSGNQEEVETWEGENALRERGKQIFQRGDFYLSDEEQALVEQTKQHFKHIIVVLNVGGVVDTEWFVNDGQIQVALLAWQGGMEGGLATADILCGDVNPSGKLTDTFAKHLEDYPSSDGFHNSSRYVEYQEDIYVGYRYFETIPGKAKLVNYPFGYGLSYTQFEKKVIGFEIEEDIITCDVVVKNIGKTPGKEVVQLYYSAPQGKLGKPFRELAAFAKTDTLLPSKKEILQLTFPLADMASYDDTGKIMKSAYILEKGEYKFYIGSSVRETAQIDTSYTVNKDIVIQQLSEKLCPSKLSKRMLSDGTYEYLKQSEYEKITRPVIFETPEKLEGLEPEVRFEERKTLQERLHPVRTQLSDVAEGKITLDEFMKDLTEDEITWLLGGQPNLGVADTFGVGNNKKHGIPNVMTADGPAGLRILPERGVYTTAWPCTTMLACTWNCKIVFRIGKAGALEIKENNIGIWLTPAMNIHRSPLCGRNFEYYSEDPLLTGKMGTAMVQGIQSKQIAAVPKHFALNNKETNRKHSDSRVSERAAREIYLKAFEIVVKEAHPMILMSSYNMINGRYSSENRELLTDILRNEWGFDGAVVTDWWTRAQHWREVAAGNDIKMANGYPEELKEALADGRLSLEDTKTSVKRVLNLILKL